MQDPTNHPPVPLRYGWIRIALLPLLSLFAVVPLGLLSRGFSQEVQRNPGWEPIWANEIFIMFTGISLGLLITAPFISRWMVKRFQTTGFWRRTGVVLASAFAWAVGTTILWGATLLVHGLWVRNLGKFREALAFDQVLGGLLGVMLFFTIPLTLIGGLIARFIFFKSTRAT